MKQMSQRQLQTAEKIRRVLAEIWEDFDFKVPRISLTEVQISPDLKYATIFYMPSLGKEVSDVQKQLNESVKMIRYHLAQQADLRVTPELKFVEDTLDEKLEHLTQVLKGTGDV